MKHTFGIVMSVLAVFSVIPESSGASSVPDRASATALSSSTDLGWTKLNLNNFFDVIPENPPSGIHGKEGPAGVLHDWNGGAWDSTAGCMYFHGGGHGGYFGNEVYRFCLSTQKWERLNEPSRIVVYEQAVAQNLFNPENGYSAPPHPEPGKEFLIPFGPASTHTYDGVWIHDGKFWVVASSVFQGGYRNYAAIHTALFAFNPVRRKWEKKSPFVTDSGKLFGPTYPASALMSNGRMKISGSNVAVEFDFTDNKFKKWQGHTHGGSAEGSMIIAGGLVYSLSYDRRLMIYRETETMDQARGIPLPEGVGYTSGLAERRGVLYLRPESGGIVHSFNVATEKFATHQISRDQNAPDRMRPFSQWTYDEKTDSFYTGDWSGNFWRWRITDVSGQPVFRSSLTKEKVLIANTKNGLANIPKGIYGGSGIVSIAVDADWNQSELTDKTLGKGVLVIRSADGPVTMRNFIVRGGQGAVRDESDGILSLVGVTAENTVEGLLLSGNGGTGVYNIVSSVASGGAVDSARARGSLHNVYIGVSKTATFVDFKSLGHIYSGHLLKSRSTDLTLLDSRLDGLTTPHSRAIDWNPEAPGTLLIENSHIIQSANAENFDFIGIAQERSSHAKVKNLKVMIRNSSFVCNKPRMCYVSVGSGVNVTFDIDDATKAASKNVRWP